MPLPPAKSKTIISLIETKTRIWGYKKLIQINFLKARLNPSLNCIYSCLLITCPPENLHVILLLEMALTCQSQHGGMFSASAES